MSASDKKKLRREQNAVAMTEKQRQASKDAKKLKAYTLTFVIVMVLVVAIMVGIFVRTPIAGAISRGTNAVTIGSHELSTADLSYFYVDAIMNHYSQYSSYGNYAAMYAMMMDGINFATPVGDQIYDEESGKTWAEHYIEQAIESATSVYALYDAAMADEDFKISDEDQEYLDNLEDYIDMYAKLYGFSSAAGYLRQNYGAGANMKTFRTYSEVTMVASEYYNHHMESIEYTDSDYREYEKDKFVDYSSFSYAIYQITVSDYLTGGTTVKDENGKESITYSDVEKLAAENLAKADAEALAKAENNTIELLNAAIQALDINKKTDSEKDDKEDAKLPTATEQNDVLYTNISNEDLQKWLADDARENGNITFIEKSTTSTDKDGKETKTVTGYYVVLFLGRDNNEMKLHDARHILAKFEGGKTDSTTNKTTYSDAEKAAAKKAAEEILAKWNALEKKDEDAFAELANKHSDDGDGTTGGLYEDIYPGQMVENFENWVYDVERKEGDVEMIETEYGYHIMYYVGQSELTYRDFMIDADMLAEEMEEWEKGLADAMSVVEGKLSGMDHDYCIS